METRGALAPQCPPPEPPPQGLLLRDRQTDRHANTQSHTCTYAHTPAHAQRHRHVCVERLGLMAGSAVLGPAGFRFSWTGPSSGSMGAPGRHNPADSVCSITCVVPGCPQHLPARVPRRRCPTAVGRRTSQSQRLSGASRQCLRVTTSVHASTTETWGPGSVPGSMGQPRLTGSGWAPKAQLAWASPAAL